MSNEAFNPLAYGWDVIDHAIRFRLGETIFFTVAGAGLYAAHEMRTAYILHSGRYRGPTAIIQTTSYDPAVERNAETGVLELLINPETGNNFRDQKIRTEAPPLNLSDMFDKDVAGRLVKYFKKAAEHTSPSAPIINMHIEAVLPEKDRERIHELIKNSVQNYISGEYRSTERFLAEDLAPNEIFETRKILPLMIREEGAMGWQLRILLLRLNEQNTIDLPDPRDVRYFMPDGSYQTGDASVEIDRFKALQIIKDTLENTDEGPRLFEYAVEIPTGRKISFPAPKEIPVIPTP